MYDGPSFRAPPTRAAAAEAPRRWAKDDFYDEDLGGWAIMEGDWAASSGTLACTDVDSISGAPGGDEGAAPRSPEA